MTTLLDVLAALDPSTRAARTNYARFLAFHAHNPHVADRLEELAQNAWDAGRRRIGMKMCMEVLRYWYIVETTGDEFRLNNSFTPFYARLLLDRRPEWEGFFELREVNW